MSGMWIRSRGSIVGRAIVAAALLAGCETFDSVDEACPDGDSPGAAALGPVELDAIRALNCYRRLSGLGRAPISAAVQEAVEGHADYILANPDAERLYGDGGPTAYLGQDDEEESFTGATLARRLDAAGYFFAQPEAVTAREFLFVAVSGYVPLTAEDDTMVSGGPAMDALMREHEWRELALQRSWRDGGYTEIELTADWFDAAGVCGFRPELCGGGDSVPATLTGRMYYIVVVHDDPPIQGSFSPFSFPKAGQLEVPRYSMSLGEVDPETGAQQQVQISYPISVFGNASDPATATPDAPNVYGLRVDAEITDAAGTTFETRVVHPGEEASGVFPDGLGLRRSVAIYIDRPFEPLTRYTLTADVETNEAIYELEMDFVTRSDDPGLGEAPAAAGRALRASLSYGPDAAVSASLGGGPGITP